MKCDQCDRPAVVHEVIIKNGKKSEVHLCEDHAKMAGVDMPTNHPVADLLSQNIIMSTGLASGGTGGGVGESKREKSQKTCSECGMSFARFRQHGTLGCPRCYEAFEEQLGSLIERIHGGATHHVGKTPRRAGGSIDRQRLIQKLVRELDEAVAAEQYERAAQLRDRLSNLEPGQDRESEVEGQGSGLHD